MQDAQIRVQQYEPLGIGVGTLLCGRYDIVRKIGSGGMSAVYEAIDRKLENTRIAVKLLNPQVTSDNTVKERFRNEILITRKLTHPNIVRTFDFGESETGHQFITMEFINGTSLDRLLHNGRPLPISDVTRILYDVIKAVSYAHSNDVLHRDIKPGNILLTKDGVVKLTDFGLARSEDFEKRFTQTGECVGTPYYMSPEQIQGKAIDHRADLFACGIIAFEMSTGRVPFAEESWYNLATKIIKEPLPALGGKQNQVEPWFESFVRKATEKHADERFTSAEEMLGVLKDHVSVDEPLSEVFSTAAPTIRQPHIDSMYNRGLTGPSFYKMAPYLFAGGIITMVVLVALAMTERQAGNVAENLDKGTRTISEFVDTLHQLKEAVVFTHQNKDKIDKFIAEKSNEKEDNPAVAPDLDLDPVE
ncbi:MAG: serine/threonine protein kinase [Bdellovibrionales bacterium]|nr:serine/threonine protein kinase [Bdellovibrionales bacterium]